MVPSPTNELTTRMLGTIPNVIRKDSPPSPQQGSPLPTDNAARKALPIMTFLAEYFPDAIVALTELSVICNEQHNPGERLHWARDKSKDQINTAFRHLFDRARGQHFDTDGARHIAKTAWRALAQLQLDIEAGAK